MAVLMSFAGCFKTVQVKQPPQIWWGKAGDTIAWEEAKVIMENYDWAVMSQDALLGN